MAGTVFVSKCELTVESHVWVTNVSLPFACAEAQRTHADRAQVGLDAGAPVGTLIEMHETVRNSPNRAPPDAPNRAHPETPGASRRGATGHRPIAQAGSYM